MFQRLLTVLALACFPLAVNAEPERELHLDAEWLRINSYENRGGKWDSHIRNSEFFFHTNGQNNPKAELTAFIKAVYKTPQESPEIDRICRYPARLAFLAKHHTPPRSILDICSAKDSGQIIDATQSISLIFADGYFGNPASYYGHVLLKLNSKASPEENEIGLLDTAINYGANIPPKENALVYIFKGVFGFYKGSFQTNEFFLNTAQYADQQSRDFWAYDLNLTPQQARHIARRAIEWKNAEFDYYFFGDNCAHRVRDLLAEVTGKKIAGDNGLWLMPMQVLVGASRLERRDTGKLISNIRYLPSGRTKLFAVLDSLSSSEMIALRQFLDGNKTKLNALSKPQRKIVLAAAELHLRKAISDAEAKPSQSDHAKALKEKRKEVLLSLLRLKATKSAIAKPKIPVAPHSGGRNGTAVTLGLTKDAQMGHGQYLTIRPAYTDKLTIDIGKIPDSTLYMGKMDFSHFETNFRLEKLTFIQVENLRAAQFDQRFDPGRVWHLSAGLNRNNSHPKNALKGFLKVGLGRNYLVADKLNAYGMAHIHIAEKNPVFEEVYAGLRVGVVSHITDRAKLHIVHSLRQKKDDTFSRATQAALRAGLTLQTDIEMKWQNNDDDEDRFVIGLQRHF